MVNEQSVRGPLSVKPTTQTASSDEALAARGGTESFVLLYRAHVRAVYRYLYARLGNAQDAEDVTAQTFERVWSSLPRYKPDAPFRSWLFTIAQRALTDHYRRRKPHGTSIENAGLLPDPAPPLEEGAFTADQVQRVLHLVAGLKPEQQQVLALRFGGELRYDEIARVLNKRESAVKMIAYRALEEIQRRLDDVQAK
jgi:RNA polymerase sigma-70 factor, ECF subfamily